MTEQPHNRVSEDFTTALSSRSALLLVAVIRSSRFQLRGLSSLCRQKHCGMWVTDVNSVTLFNISELGEK
jgi:hypothetical protein